MVIFCGVALATLLTLYVVPVTYIAIARGTGSPKALSRELERLQQLAPDEHAADEVVPK